MARRWTPARIASLLGLNPSTVLRVLVRYRCSRPAHLDRAPSRPVRRYEHAAPVDLVHVDIKKLGAIPDDGGHRVTDRATGLRNKKAQVVSRSAGSRTA
ncbi:helix-turn-helix domain-containing protein [Amycolatopsis sp. FDAARGOS 1241]|nr:helix-turn-helix domain-containing protein [Amycolatopsis sp. FDAARGOS 1241]